MNQPASPPKQSLSERVGHNAALAVDLYKGLSGGGDNDFISPHSIGVALAMTYAGARGTTAAQMDQALHFGRPPEHLHHSFAELMQALKTPKDAGYELAIANALWGQERYKFEPAFIQGVQESYGALVKTINFGNAAEAKKAINDWVATATRDKIKDLIPDGVLDELTRLVLVNAIYFKGTWATKFDPKATKQAPFTLLGGKTIKAPMMIMNKPAKLGYAATDTADIVELPYAGDTVSMVLVVPKQKDGLPAVESALTADALTAMIGSLRPEEVLLTLPKFKLETAFELSGALKKMGMTDAFAAPPADFSGMNGGKDLAVSAVLHKAFVEVNEEGTEAAAATAVVVATKGMPRPPTEVRADHPFLFLIRHKPTGEILFLGRLMSPKA